MYNFLISSYSKIDIKETGWFTTQSNYLYGVDFMSMHHRILYTSSVFFSLASLYAPHSSEPPFIKVTVVSI